MHRTITPSRALLVAALFAFTGAASADPGMYATFSYGNAAVNETGNFGIKTLAFAGPTVDHDICSTTATITIGAEPIVSRFDGDNSEYRIGIGWRGDGQLAWEFNYFNVARIATQARSGPYVVAQPGCPDFTISAGGVKIERVTASGFSFGPVYHIPLATRFDLELRATVNIYDQREESQWQVEVTEFNIAADPLRTYPTASVEGRRDSSGVDGGLGIGVSYELTDTARARLSFERQVMGNLTLKVLLVGVTLGF